MKWKFYFRLTGHLEKALERGERIELLVDKTENLSSNAFKFKKQSTALKRSMWWKNVKLLIVIAIVVLVSSLVGQFVRLFVVRAMNYLLHYCKYPNLS